MCAGTVGGFVEINELSANIRGLIQGRIRVCAVNAARALVRSHTSRSTRGHAQERSLLSAGSVDGTSVISQTLPRTRGHTGGRVPMCARSADEGVKSTLMAHQGTHSGRSHLCAGNVNPTLDRSHASSVIRGHALGK